MTLDEQIAAAQADVDDQTQRHAVASAVLADDMTTKAEKATARRLIREAVALLPNMTTRLSNLQAAKARSTIEAVPDA